MSVIHFEDLLHVDGKEEVGRLAEWSVTSAKAGNGPDTLRDNNLNTFWQSEGPQPHCINIQFEKKTAIEVLSFYTDYRQDESYTPQAVSIRAGTSHHDLKELVTFDLDPTTATGWTTVRLEGEPGSGRPPRAFLLQLAILTNQLSGRDTRIRQIKLFATRRNFIQD
ncbi:Anaphase-promoting complex subunit 10 [Actinomortierella ambigua]|uniref:Anaphase-promoting complex subunit 10 n=1 Tax=Actinomortierella ambigua TaxID=1343610 RepID=A0A9P6QAG2_9FUNG|nr:Anaphase-promoting complex subunit 10 [Actinomortierella ambigua]